jgi:hypothetical protein
VIDGDEQVERAFRGPHLGDVEVEVTDGVLLEHLAGRLITIDDRGAGSRLIPWRARQRCRLDRVR